MEACCILYIDSPSDWIHSDDRPDSLAFVVYFFSVVRPDIRFLIRKRITISRCTVGRHHSRQPDEAGYSVLFLHEVGVIHPPQLEIPPGFWFSVSPVPIEELSK